MFSLITDVEFVTTHDGALPTLDNSTPLENYAGRGSCVWFNQASMFQPGELEYPTIAQAQAAGAEAETDFQAHVDEGYFPYFDIDDLPTMATST